MLTNQIKDRTVKDIFKDRLGEETAEDVLTKIQKEYDKGVRGEALKDFAKGAIDEIPSIKSEERAIMVGILVSFGIVFTA